MKLQKLYSLVRQAVDEYKMIEENDLEQCNELLQTTLITMAIQTKARKQASIVFPAD